MQPAKRLIEVDFAEMENRIAANLPEDQRIAMTQTERDGVTNEDEDCCGEGGDEDE